MENMSGNNEIQKIEVDSGTPILCPICNHCVLDENLEVTSLSPCSHTIFIATDEGIEYKTSLFENNLKDGDQVDIVFEATINEWHGNENIQIKLTDIALSN